MDNISPRSALNHPVMRRNCMPIPFSASIRFEIFLMMSWFAGTILLIYYIHHLLHVCCIGWLYAICFDLAYSFTCLCIYFNHLVTRSIDQPNKSAQGPSGMWLIIMLAWRDHFALNSWYLSLLVVVIRLYMSPIFLESVE